MGDPTLYIGEIWTPDPKDIDKLVAIPDGCVAAQDGKIVAVGENAKVTPNYPQAKRVESPLITPGFIDTHIHFPQVDMIGSPGEELLGWLSTYTYPAEKKFAAQEWAEQQAPRFFDLLADHGTTTAAIYGTTHAHSARVLFEEAKRRNACAIIGKVSMDREGPAELQQDTIADRRDNESLIADFHGFEERLFAALTPRFAIACSDQLLRSLGELAASDPTLYVQTHHAENQDEVAFTKKLFANCTTYASIYDHFGLLREKTILGHSVHVESEEWKLLADRDVAIAHCPTSNAFLGSGLFDWQTAEQRGVGLSIATDVGAGTDLSMWRTLGMAYNIQALRGHRVSPAKLFYQATMGGAHALRLDDRIGSIEVGKRADLQLIDPAKHPLISERFQSNASLDERLFSLITMGDRQIVTQSVIGGKIYPV